MADIIEHDAEAKKRRQQAWRIIRDYNREILKNEFQIPGKGMYNVLTAKDVINRLDNSICAFCYLHDKHTPCGIQLNKWKDCRLKEEEEKGFGSESVKETGREIDDDKSECNKFFMV